MTVNNHNFVKGEIKIHKKAIEDGPEELANIFEYAKNLGIPLGDSKEIEAEKI